MTFAEIILRLGSSIGGWLIFAGYGLTLAVLPQADCDPNSSELWRGTLLFAVVSAIGLVFVGRGLQWAGTLRWLTIPAMGLALLAAYGIVPAVTATLFGGQSLCVIASPNAPSLAGSSASTLERIWPALQLGVLAAGLAQGIRYWRAPGVSAQHD